MQESSFIAGIDWAAELYVVCILDNDGRVIERLDVIHDNGRSCSGRTPSLALRVMVSRFRRTGVTKVAIERGDGPVAEGIDRCGAHSVRGPVTSDQSPTDPLRIGREQGRPPRRIRPRGHATHRRSPVAAAARRSPGNQSATGDVPGPQGSRRDSSAGDEPTPVQPRAGVPYSPRAVQPHRQPHSRWLSCADSPPQPKARGFHRRQFEKWWRTIDVAAPGNTPGAGGDRGLPRAVPF